MTRLGEVLGPIPVVVHDVDTALSNVTVTASSDNQKLIPDANIVLGAPVIAGTNKTYSLTLFPIGTASGSANVTLTANDGTKSSTLFFNVFVQDPGVPLFVAPNTIIINANTNGTPYPSTNTVSGLI